MTLAKIVTKTLDVGVKYTKIDLSATIKSYDLTDTKFIFNITSNQWLNIDLTGSTAMYIVEYVHNSQNYAIQGDVDIVDSTTIAFSLPKDLKGYRGNAIIGLYVQMADGTKIDLKDIVVKIEPSIMDKGIDFAAKTYFKDFETIKAEVVLEGEKAKTGINAVVSDVNGYADSQKQIIHNTVTDVQSTGDTAKADINATLPTFKAEVVLEGEKAKTGINAVVSDVNGYADSQKQAIHNIVADVQSTGDTAKEDINATLPTLQGQVSDINNTINNTIEVDVEKILGKYIYKNTYIYDEKGAFYTRPFYVEKNTKLTIFAKGYQTYVAILCSCDENGNNRTLLVQSTDSTEKEYCYTVPNASYMVVCSYDIPNFRIEKTISMLNKIDEKVDKLSVEVEKINQKVNVYPNYMMMFERIGGIGDSLMSGEIQVPNYEQGTSTFTDVPSQSWLSHIARKTNAEYKCYSRGGHTCKSWLNSPLYSQLATDPKANAYFIGLLSNDKLTSAGYDIGTINDVSGNDSFVGYYKQIVEYVRAQAPNAIIFCMSGYDNDEKDVQYSTMVKDICDLYDNCFYIDFANNTDMHISTHRKAMKYVTGSHYTTIGYIKISEEIMNIVNGVIDSNYEKFRYFSLNYI